MFKCTEATVNKSLMTCRYVVEDVVTLHQDNPLSGLLEDFETKCADQGYIFDHKSLVIDAQRNLFSRTLDVRVVALVKRSKR